MKKCTTCCHVLRYFCFSLWGVVDGKREAHFDATFWLNRCKVFRYRISAACSSIFWDRLRRPDFRAPPGSVTMIGSERSLADNAAISRRLAFLALACSIRRWFRGWFGGVLGF